MHPSIRALFHGRGAIRAGELQEILSAKRISSLIRDGHLHRPWHGVYTLPNPTVEIQLRALDLVADAHVPVCMGTAAASYGFDTERDGVLHVINPVPGQLRPRPNLVVHQRLGAPLRYVDGRLTTAPDWTAIEIARTLRPSRAIGTLDAALRSGHCSPGGLRHATRMQAGRRGIVHVRDLLTHADGRSESPMESETRLLFIDSGVPAPELQATICDRYGTAWRVDFLWRSARLIGEYDSDEWHSGPQPCARTNSKRRAYKNAAGRSFLSPSTTFDVIGTSLSHESTPICVTTPREHAQICRISAYSGAFAHARR
ncbi:hypothetical protein L831_4970 [Mycobacteroides abscessus MAB_082312_2272]|nr:hypothetical protein L831_4970 [Mycobacteroides abscessus MAB_082312_2272]